MYMYIHKNLFYVYILTHIIHVHTMYNNTWCMFVCTCIYTSYAWADVVNLLLNYCSYYLSVTGMR